MTTALYCVADVHEALAAMPAGCVDLVMTSPPFLALRSYLPAEHPYKAQEIGSEPTPAAYLQTLLDCTAAWSRVLAPHGSMVIELGDTFSGSGGAGGDYGPVGLRNGQPPFDGSAARTRSNRPGQYGTNTGPPRRAITDDWPLDKCLACIPALYEASLAYGRNLLTGVPSPAGQWRVRNLIAWVRPNPPVGALGDKFRPATSYLICATRAANRYFDLDAVRTPYSDSTMGRWGDGASTTNGPHTNRAIPIARLTQAGAPPLDWWEIPTYPYGGTHYATWPPQLCVRPILAMCPQRVCVTCGQPSRRIVNQVSPRVIGAEGQSRQAHRTGGTFAKQNTMVPAAYETLGWTDCGHDHWRAGRVLDPFAGSGTTLAVATGHGRDAIGIDIDANNVDLAQARVGMFMSQVDLGGLATWCEGQAVA